MKNTVAFGLLFLALMLSGTNDAGALLLGIGFVVRLVTP